MTAAPVFEEIRDWGEGLPDVRAHDISDVAVSARGDCYLLYRDPSFIVVSSPGGAVRRVIASEVLGARPHGITVLEDGSCYVVDEGDHCVRLIDPEGRQAASFGSGPSNPEFRQPVKGDYSKHIAAGYPPFTRPTRIAVADSGHRYVSDGYGNACVHRFSERHDLLESWGGPGTAAGEFHLPHDVMIDSRGRVVVSDRENDRVQVFDRDGACLAQWTEVQRPQGVVEGPDGLLYVAEGEWRPGNVSRRLGPTQASGSRVSILDDQGRVLDRIGPEAERSPASFIAAHGIAMDPDGDLYVAEVSFSVLQRFPDMRPPDRKAIRKFRRRG